MKRFSLTLIFIAIASCVFAQGIVGDWYGALNIQGTTLPLVFHITKTGDIYSTLMDSPKQGAKGFATGITTVNGNNITIEAATAGISYTGRYLPDSDKISGVFKQRVNGAPLTFFRNEAAANPAAKVRPQDPKDFPYKQEEVAFDNTKGGDRLAGTLTMPADGKASKIVVLITGSGPQDRNEALMGHRPFLVWSDWLTRHGIAVLRYDDRGIAKSTGNFGLATSADFAHDAEAAVNYILSRPDLKNLSIGLMGHSEGGLIAPMVASRNKAVKFIVLLAGPGVPTEQLMVKQTADLMVGAPPNVVARYADRNKKLYDIVIQNPALPTVQLQQVILSALYQDMHDHPNEGADSAIVKSLAQAYAPLLAPWMRYFLAVDPAVYLTKVKCPVLALDGTKDLQVNAEANLAGIKASLEKAGNKHFEVVTLDGLNHLFQKAGTGAVSEYSQIEETVDPVALDKVTTWINKL